MAFTTRFPVKYESILVILKITKKYLLMILGSLSIALGLIGIFLPVLPTTGRPDHIDTSCEPLVHSGIPVSDRHRDQHSSVNIENNIKIKI